jgi:AraC-like DNA-binding protein
LDLLSSVDLLHKDRILTPFGRWVDDLHFTCGSFRPSSMDTAAKIRGEARRINACGMEFSQISNDLDQIDRDWNDVRRDASEQLFLIVQLEGSCGVEHAGAHSTLNMGDCILIESTKPTTFYFRGRYSNHISVNLPQQALILTGGDSFNVARKLDAYNPMATMLRALVAQVLEETDEGDQAARLRQLTFNATRQAFLNGVDPATGFDMGSDTVAERLQMADVLIDQHLTNSYLTAKWLAGMIGVSMRVLQLDFQRRGMTCTTYIRDKRLQYARTQIERIGAARGAQTIADIAYSVGFNDVSYFNRCFKDLFGCTPSDLLHAPVCPR